MAEKVAILDAGAQYGKVIDRRVRELGVESDLLPMDTPIEKLGKYAAIIISGGPESVTAPNAPKVDKRLFVGDIPVLGICYGMQLMNVELGGAVGKADRREDCETLITVDPDVALFEGLDKEQQVLMSHGDTVLQVAKGFMITARSESLPAAMQDSSRKLYATQFHPEVDLTTNGKKILSNFLYRLAGLNPSFTLDNRVGVAVADIKKIVGDCKVLVLVSGGVDSTVCAALLAKALRPEQVYALHIDNGFMRKGESEGVKRSLEPLGINLNVVDASQDFYDGSTNKDGLVIGPLRKIIDPEQKRRIIGDVFMQVAQREIDKLGLSSTTFLAQGTLRPDLIESASSLASEKADVIKTHHNDSPMVRKKRNQGLIIEPNRDLHKDEVRSVGEKLGLSRELVWRQPFPGPGLAVRILCAEEPVLEDYDAIFGSLQRFADDDLSVSLLPVRSVGVQGDGRSYSRVAVLSGKADWSKLKTVANAIPKHVPQVNRVVYAFGGVVDKPLKQVTKTYLEPRAIKVLQEADSIVTDALHEHAIYKDVAQLPVILVPIDFKGTTERSIVLRPFITNDFMTGLPALPVKDLPLSFVEDCVKRICALEGIDRVLYDLTSKPPGTTEWE